MIPQAAVSSQSRNVEFEKRRNGRKEAQKSQNGGINEECRNAGQADGRRN